MYGSKYQTAGFILISFELSHLDIVLVPMWLCNLILAITSSQLVTVKAINSISKKQAHKHWSNSQILI